MAPKSRFTRLDAFTKTVDEARVRTTSGGIVTIVSLLIVLYLAFSEWLDYRRVVVRPELVVDKTRGEKMEIWMNITFPHIPCELLTLDVMDVSGEMQVGVKHGVLKIRLSPGEEGGRAIDIKTLDLHSAEDQAAHLDPTYCGECYGAPAPSNAQKQDCCNTCDEVRDAYAAAAWQFGRKERDTVEQCKREHYSERLDAQRNEGCRIEGGIRVNKVIGNFHIAPGRSYSDGNMHVHDLATYWDTPLKDGHSFGHTIHHLRFGPKLPDTIRQRLDQKDALWSNHHLNPLDDTTQETRDPAFNFMYFVKVVSTSYLPLDWSAATQLPSGRSGDDVGLGIYGQGQDGSIQTHQYSVTSHKRSLRGGDDSADGHKEREHARSGIPGVFFSYDISPMKVINREERSKTLASFITALCAIVGGTLTVAAAVDRGLYEGVSRLKKLQAKTL